MAHMKRQQDSAKRSDRSTTRNPGTAKRPPGKADTHARPFSSPDDKPPVENPRDINRASLPSEQPTKKKARAVRKREERRKEEETPKPHNLIKGAR